MPIRTARDPRAAVSPLPFFRHVAITELTLLVRRLAPVVDFYRDVLGLREVESRGADVWLSPTGRPPSLIVLRHAPDAPAPPVGAAGLFHVALLYPDRAALGRALHRAVEAGLRLGGADHGVSEALYLADPEGNGIELYRDRQPAEWPMGDDDGRVAMHSDPLDFQGIAAAGSATPGPPMPPETRIGHLHLRVSDLDLAERFYAGALDFPVRQRDYPGARFFGRDGYHHHIGTNVWHSRRPALPGALGLAGFTIELAPEAYVLLVNRLRANGDIERGAMEGVQVRDLDGIPVHLRVLGTIV